MKKEPKKCILKYCNAYITGGGKGLCPVHYKESKQRVKNGLITWEQLAIGGVAVCSKIRKKV